MYHQNQPVRWEKCVCIFCVCRICFFLRNGQKPKRPPHTIPMYMNIFFFLQISGSYVAKKKTPDVLSSVTCADLALYQWLNTGNACRLSQVATCLSALRQSADVTEVSNNTHATQWCLDVTDSEDESDDGCGSIKRESRHSR